jgi:Flp pilus assembly protein TadG
MKHRLRFLTSDDRRGAAAVEFALVAPLFIVLVMGSIQAGFNFDHTNKMYSVVRQAGRLAALDTDGERPLPGQSMNNKIIADIKNTLTANGLPGSQATVTIGHAEGASAGSTFDLSDPANDYKYYRISVSLPYSAINENNLLPNTLTTLSASVVFRKGRTSTVQ